MSIKRRILNWTIGFACLIIVIYKGYRVYDAFVMGQAFPTFTIISLFGWLFVTICFFYIDAIGAIKEIIQLFKRARRIKDIKTRKND